MIQDPRRAAVVAIGNELVEGGLVDTNSGEIARRLAELGIDVEQFAVLGDHVSLGERTLRELCAAYPIVVATGGLGPTLDDVTRESAAAAAGVELVRDDSVLDGLRELYRQRNRPMPEANERQAWFPAGAQIMPNACGTAAGFRVWVGGGMLAVLPGPPREMRDMLERELLPWIRATCGQGPSIEFAHFYLTGLPESQFADQVGAWMSRAANPRLDVTAHHGMLHAKLRAQATSRAGALAVLATRAEEFRERFADHIFSETEARLERVLGDLLLEKNITLALAESCTGGGVAQRITEVPGISRVFREGWVTYTNESKMQRLGVPRALLDQHGAVSSAVAEAMALGAARESGASLALAVTGIAGPDGGSADKPVGLTWFAVAFDGAVQSFERRFPLIGREAIRLYAVQTALELLWRASADASFGASSRGR